MTGASSQQRGGVRLLNSVSGEESFSSDLEMSPPRAQRREPAGAQSPASVTSTIGRGGPKGAELEQKSPATLRINVNAYP